eukprot:GHVL01018485.1.p1 GENE.GHVL01018485.1~~GHVL01018485.1.p1  ORF type:complete len:1093 (+),score=261.77 GHVL01018485.1:69-3347(+)
MAKSIREADTKKLLKEFGTKYVSISRDVDIDKIDISWLFDRKLVVKPDILLKRRGKSGLVKLNMSWDEVKTFINEKIGTELTMEGLTGELTHFIVEPMFPHDDVENEMYLAIRTLRKHDEILFCSRGGVNVGDVESVAKKVLVPIRSDGKISKIVFPDTFFADKNKERAVLEKFIQKIYENFCENHFAFLELNPICFDEKTNEIVILDAAAKLDHAAEFLCEDSWGLMQFPAPFGRVLTEAEAYIRELDSKTGASLKLTILNKLGRIWTMIAGGGASVVYSDTICSYKDAAKELANYGEYSGAPSEVTTYEYAKTILKLITAEGTFREEGKVLLIGGGIANFTSVADTFKGIIRAIREFQNDLRQFKVSIYVRRGGPSYQDGLKLMRQLGQETDLPIKVYGPETYITDIIPLSLENDKLLGKDIAGQPTCEKDASIPRIKTWHETSFEDVEQNDAFQRLRPDVIPEEAEAEFPPGGVKSIRSLFNSQSTCFIWGLQNRAVQEMLDFDHVCGRKEPSVSGIIYEFSVSHVRPFYFGSDEIFIPVCQTMAEAVQKFPTTNILVNFASMRSAGQVTQRCMEQFPSVQIIAVIAEGVPERCTRQLIATSYEKNVTILGPATVGGIKSGCFRIGNTGGRLENIMNSKLYRPGNVAFVTKSGGMLNEMNNILSLVANGTYEGVAIGGDRFPGTTMLEHLLRYEADSNVAMMVLLGEVGGDTEYEVVEALKKKTLTKPLVSWCVGTCAPLFSTEVSFGHAGAWAGSNAEHADAKNKALANAGSFVPKSFQDLGSTIKQVYDGLVSKGIIAPFIEPEAPRVPMDYAWAKKLGLVRKPKGFVSTISDDRGEELVYAGWPISKVMQTQMGVGGVIALLWFKRPLPDYCYRYLEIVLMLTADHGPAVCGAHNTIVTARAGKDLISSLISGLCTIGDRFGGACDMAAQQFLSAYDRSLSPEEFVKEMKQKNELIMGIGHKIKSVHNPDMRVTLLKNFCKKHLPIMNIIKFAEEVEQLTTRKKDTLILNVDGLIGVSMVDMLFYCGAFSDSEARDYISCGCINGLFVLGRSIGFIGHFLDQKRLKQGLYRHDADDISYVLPDLGL